MFWPSTKAAAAAGRCWWLRTSRKALQRRHNARLKSGRWSNGIAVVLVVFVLLLLLLLFLRCYVQVAETEKGQQVDSGAAAAAAAALSPPSAAAAAAYLRPLRSVMLEPMGGSNSAGKPLGQTEKEEESFIFQSRMLLQSGLERVEAFLATFNCTINFFLAWTTPPSTFTLRYRRTIESALLFHPEACLVVFSPTLPSDYFAQFWELGYKIVVESPNVQALLRNTPAEKWLQGVELWRQGPYFFSHITEIIRLATLYKYGGVYLDTDVIVMKNLASLRNCLGTEELAGVDSDSTQVKVLNGAVLIFDRGSSFIWECIKEFNNTYKIESWGWNGPELVTRVARRFPQGADLHILPVAAFYPIHWRQVHKYFEVAHFDDSQHSAWEIIKENTYIFHYWNKVTKDMVPKYGSLMYKRWFASCVIRAQVLNNYCILCEDKGADG